MGVGVPAVLQFQGLVGVGAVLPAVLQRQSLPLVPALPGPLPLWAPHVVGPTQLTQQGLRLPGAEAAWGLRLINGVGVHRHQMQPYCSLQVPDMTDAHELITSP